MPVLARLPVTQARDGPEIQLSTGSAARVWKTTRAGPAAPGAHAGPRWPSPRKEPQPHPGFLVPGRMPRPRPEVRRGTHQAEGASGTGSDSWLPGGGERRAGSGLTLPLRGFPGSLREGDGGQGGCQRPVTAVSRDPRNIKNEELAKQAHTNYRAVGFKRFH